MTASAAPPGRPLRLLVDAPTVRVEVVELPGGVRAVRKVYALPSWRRRLAAVFGHAWLGRAKGPREAANLARLARGGAPVLAPLGSGERRDRLGFVRASWLLTPFLDGAPTLLELLRGGSAPVAAAVEDRAALWREIGAGVARIHRLGCRYRHLRARNLLLGPDGPRWIDASKSRWRRAPLARALAAADLHGFLAPLEQAGWLTAADWSAFGAGYRPSRPELALAELERLISPRERARCRRELERELARLRR